MSRGKSTMNRDELAQWIDNDEGLYRWWLSSKQSKRQFIQDNRTVLVRCITNVTSGNRRQHYLIYG